jgi:hypothetical protein
MLKMNILFIYKLKLTQNVFECIQNIGKLLLGTSLSK